MEKRRKFPRTALPQKARFFGAKGWEDCTITEASREGLSIQFYTSEKIKAGSLIHLKVLMPSEPNPVDVQGMLKWIEEKGEHYIGGVELYHIDRVVKEGTNTE